MKISDLDIRKRIILKKLLYKDSPITTKELSKILGVSSRTVYNDINYLKYLFKDEDVHIVSRPGVGFWLETNEKIIKNLKKELDKEIKTYNDEKQRFNYIAARLLSSDIATTMQELGDNLYVSKSTVNIDIKHVEEWFKKYNLSLYKKTNHGIRIIGDEKDIRYCIQCLLIENTSVNNIYQFKSDKRNLFHVFDEIRSIDIFTNIKADDLFNITNVVNEIQREKELNFTNESYCNLFLNLSILVDRIARKKYVQFSEADIMQFKKTKEYEITTDICRSIKKYFQIDFIESEKCYITLNLIGLKINVDSFINNKYKIISKMDNYTEEIIEYTMKFIENKFNINLKKNKELLLGLKIHLNFAINRMKYGMKAANSLLEEIKKNYPYSFNIALEIGKTLKDKFNINVYEEEAGYIALYIQGYVEKDREDKDIKTYLVCNSGIGFVNLLNIQLKKEFKNLNIVKMISGEKLEKEIKKLGKRDLPQLIISTIPLENIKLPFVHVKPILSENDMKKIQKEIENIKGTNRILINGESSRILDYCIKPDLVFLNYECDDKEKLIKKISKELLRRGYVKEEFEQSVIDREKLSSTYVENGVAVPHGYTKHVNKTAISVIQLDKYINWNGEKVNIVFLCAIDFTFEEFAQELFERLYEIIGDKNLLKELKKSKNRAEFINLLK
ncbi:BglG family transcription antiterminator [Maledivibacter halophilus]|uniref:Lichenan operon transcriptional antiterminator n=1 Tax=Maledivibacter halophilus TaxID=36842 RepID=A0A1T5IB44_9FIRM|nr:BglG family transcription antiterminator [Maledivibacter halophilus]SKC36377.1 lichenan operon transcriptional antiterminator [Maledivibacter halophilus]